MIRFIVALLTAGLGFWVILQITSPDSAPQALPSLPEIHEIDVTSVDIVLPSETQSTIKLRRDVNGWLLEQGKGSIAANKQAVERLVHDLSMMQPIRLLSKKAELHEQFHLGDDAVRVVLQDKKGQTLLDIFIGKQGTDLISTYVRLVGKSEALAVNRTLVWQVKRMPESWRLAESAAP
ncbi:MAG: DUF4340 domain-containing protein [Mariprofundaceae bacterium]